MTPLSVAFVATAAVCLAVGLQHLVMALRVEDRRPQLLFTFAAFAVAGDAIFERRLVGAVSAQDFPGRRVSSEVLRLGPGYAVRRRETVCG